MEKLEDVDLNELVEQASRGVLAERKELTLNSIKKLFFKIDALTSEKKQLINKTAQVDGKITKCLEIIKKLKAGDWSVLAQLNNLDKETGDKKDEKGTTLNME